MSTAPMLTIGEVIAGKYRIDALLGQGGMGAVYAATHLMTRKKVALKAILPRDADDATARGRLLREAQIAGRIQHPNVIDVYDVGEHRGVVFLVMELLDGFPLSSLLVHGPMRPVEALRLLMPALRGVAAAHASGVVHRDLKPENIFLCRQPDGATQQAKVVDFGISRPADETDLALTRTGAMMGTPMYMAPEQLAGVTAVDVRIDVYALGVVLYEVLGGGPPFEGETFALLSSEKLNEDPIPLRDRAPDVPRALERVVLKALARDPRDRFPDVPTFATALEPFAGGVVFRTSEHAYTPAPAISAPSTGMVVETDHIRRRAPSRLPWIAAVGAVLVIGALAGTLVAFRSPPPATTSGSAGTAAAAAGAAPVAASAPAAPPAPIATSAALGVDERDGGVRGTGGPGAAADGPGTGHAREPDRRRGRAPGRTGRIRLGEM